MSDEDEREIQRLETALSRTVQQMIMPVLSAVADQAALILEAQRRAAIDIRELFGRMSTVEARIDRLLDEHSRCAHCGQRQ